MTNKIFFLVCLFEDKMDEKIVFVHTKIQIFPSSHFFHLNFKFFLSSLFFFSSQFFFHPTKRSLTTVEPKYSIRRDS